jgi:hypothetical protein
VTMSGTEITDKFNAAMETSASKAQLFNNKLQAIADRSAEKLLPALEKLAPKIEDVANAFGDFLVWATDHPGQAVATALSASIAKAAIDNTIRQGIEGLLKGDGSAGTVGKLGQLGAIGALAVTAAQIGMATIDNFYTKESKRISENATGAASGAGAAAAAASRGVVSPEEKKKLEEELAAARARKKDVEEHEIGGGLAQGGGIGAMALPFLKVGALLGNEEAKEALAKSAAEQARAQKMANDTLTRLERTMHLIQTGRIKVEVTNQPKPADGQIPPDAKTGP